MAALFLFLPVESTMGSFLRGAPTTTVSLEFRLPVVLTISNGELFGGFTMGTSTIQEFNLTMSRAYLHLIPSSNQALYTTVSIELRLTVNWADLH